MATTTRGVFPYPVAADSPAVHTHIQNLAQKIADTGVLFSSGTLAARPAAAAGNAGTVYWGTDVGKVYYSNGGAWMTLTDTPVSGSAITWNDGTSPPASPAHGDLWFYPIVTNAQAWVFRYNLGGGTYKWEFIGGAPLVASGDQTYTLPNPGSAQIGSPDVKFTAPRNGIYNMKAGIFGGYSSIDPATLAWVYAINGSQSNSVQAVTPGSSAAVHLGFVEKEITLAATQIARLKFFWSLAGSGGFAVFLDPVMSITPVRIA